MSSARSACCLLIDSFEAVATTVALQCMEVNGGKGGKTEYCERVSKTISEVTDSMRTIT